MERDELKSTVEAIIFACGTPVEADRIAQALGMREGDIIAICEELRREYNDANRGVRIVRLNSSYQMCTPEIYADPIRTVLDLRRNTPLSQAAAEVLAVIAYNQPVTKAFIEQVRGVDCSGVISGLINRQLIEEKGRLELPGKPLIYGTTEHFLRCFSISSLDELPPLPDDENDGYDEENPDDGDVPSDADRPDQDPSDEGVTPDEDDSPDDTAASPSAAAANAEGSDDDETTLNDEETLEQTVSDTDTITVTDASSVSIQNKAKTADRKPSEIIIRSRNARAAAEKHQRRESIRDEDIRILNGRGVRARASSRGFGGSLLKGFTKLVDKVEKCDFNKCAETLIDRVVKPTVKNVIEPAVQTAFSPSADRSIRSAVKPMIASAVLVTAAAATLAAGAKMMGVAVKTMTTAAKLIFAALIIAAAAAQRSEPVQNNS